MLSGTHGSRCWSSDIGPDWALHARRRRSYAQHHIPNSTGNRASSEETELRRSHGSRNDKGANITPGASEFAVARDELERDSATRLLSDSGIGQPRTCPTGCAGAGALATHHHHVDW